MERTQAEKRYKKTSEKSRPTHGDEPNIGIRAGNAMVLILKDRCTFWQKSGYSYHNKQTLKDMQVNTPQQTSPETFHSKPPRQSSTASATATIHSNLHSNPPQERSTGNLHSKLHQEQSPANLHSKVPLQVPQQPSPATSTANLPRNIPQRPPQQTSVKMW